MQLQRFWILKQAVQIATIVLQRIKETHLYSSGNSVLTIPQGNTVLVCSIRQYGGKGGIWGGSLLISVPDFPRGLLLGYESRREVGTVLPKLNYYTNSHVFIRRNKSNLNRCQNCYSGPRSLCYHAYVETYVRRVVKLSVGRYVDRTSEKPDEVPQGPVYSDSWQSRNSVQCTGTELNCWIVRCRTLP
jgi:hypothetical protein